MPSIADDMTLKQLHMAKRGLEIDLQERLVSFETATGVQCDMIRVLRDMKARKNLPTIEVKLSISE